MYVIRPGEVDGEVVAGKSQVALGDLDGHVSAVHHVCAIRNLGGLIAVAGELFQHNGILACSGLVDDVLKGFPTLILLIAVNVQRHPQAVGIGGNILCTLNVKVYVLVVTCYLRTDQVISARGFLILEVAVARALTVAYVVSVRSVVRSNVLPLCLSCTKINGSVQAGRRNGICALILTGEVDKLVVVVILQLTLGGFKVTGMLVIKLVNQRIVDLGVCTAPRLGLTPCVPFIPAGYENNVGICFNCVIELLCKLISPQGCARSFLFVSVGIIRGVGASHDVLTVHGGDLLGHVVVVDSHADRHLLDHAVTNACRTLDGIQSLREYRQPAPGLGSRVLNAVFRLTCTPGKEVFDLLADRAVRYCAADAHKHGLILPIEPQILIKTGLINILIDHLRLRSCTGVIAKGQQIRYLGHVHTAVFHGILPSGVQHEIALAPGKAAVGVVRENGIYARVGKQLSLLTQYPGVFGGIKAVDRLVPEAVMSLTCPCLVIVIILSIGIFLQKLGGVDRTLGSSFLGMPGPVEHSQRLILTGCAYLGIGQRYSAQSVGKYPSVGHCLILVPKAVLGNFHGLFGLHNLLRL